MQNETSHAMSLETKRSNRSENEPNIHSKGNGIMLSKLHAATQGTKAKVRCQAASTRLVAASLL